MARRIRRLAVIGCVAGTCLAAAYGGAWWFGHASLPTGLVASIAGKQLRKAGLSQVDLSVRRVSGTLIDLGPGSAAGDGFQVSWDSIVLENPLARYRSGQAKAILVGAKLEVAAEPSASEGKPLTLADVLAALTPAFDWKVAAIDVTKARITVLRSGRRQTWTVDALGNLAVDRALAPDSLGLALRLKGGERNAVEFEARLPAAKSAEASVLSCDLNLRSSDFAALAEAASFWGVDLASTAGFSSGPLQVKARAHFDADGLSVQAFEGGADDLRYVAEGGQFSGKTLAIRMPEGAQWRSGLPDLQVDLPELSASHSGWDVRAGALHAVVRSGRLTLRHQAIAADGADGMLRLVDGEWALPVAALTGDDPFSQLTLALGQGIFEASGGTHRWKAIRGSGVSAALPIAIEELKSEWAASGARLDLPLCRLAWEQGQKRLTLEIAGWAERSIVAPSGAIELAEVPISLRSVVRLVEGAPVGLVLLDQPATSFQTRAATSQLGWNGGLRLIGELGKDVIHLDASATGTEVAVGVPDIDVSAASLALQASGLRIPRDRVNEAIAFFADSTGATPRPPGVDGCIAATVDGLAANRAGEKVAERIAASLEARIGLLDTKAGWEAVITNGRVAAGVIGLNRLVAELSGGLAGGTMAGSIHVRGTDIPLRFKQEFSWTGSPGARGTVTIEDAPISDLEPLLPLVPSLEGWEFGGRLGAELTTEAGPDGVTADGMVHLDNARAKAPDGMATVRELDGNFDVSLKDGEFTLETNGEVTAETVSSGTMELENLRGRVGLADGRLSLQGMRAGGFGGQVFLKETEMDIASGRLSTAVVLDNVALDLVLASFPDLPMKGQGRVFGEVPLRLQPSEFKIGTSVLRAGPDGLIRLTVPELDIATGERPPWYNTIERAKWDVMKRAQTAMRTVDVRELTIEFDPPAEPDTGVLIRAHGGFANEEVKANVEVEARIRGELAEIFRLGMAVMGGFPEQKPPN